ncbi:MAG: FAD-dependent oxidoreductase [Myxococcales bacterium FL481]|nr:MAG: FAD-dependent oxidoreductase [Myxococcales bacterium FL481]
MRRESFDVVVAGAGPAGLNAAAAAAQSGARVALLDDNPRPGGQIWRGPDGAHPARDQLRQTIEPLDVTSYPQCRVVTQLGASTLVVEQRGTPLRLDYTSLVLATGARERFVPFPGWDQPNVVGLGGLQALVKAGLSLEGKSIVLAGTGPLLVAVAATARRAGAQIRCIAEQASFGAATRFGLGLIAHPSKVSEAFGLLSPALLRRFRFGRWPRRALGDGALEAVELTDERGSVQTLPCDWLACAYGLAPNLELAHLLGCKTADGAISVDDHLRTSVDGVFACGEATGVAGLESALVEGALAGHNAAGDTQRADRLVDSRRRHAAFGDAIERAFAPRPQLRELADDDTIICRCEDVRVGQLRAHPSWRSAKLHTRCGMGPCQGRVCGTAVQFVFDTPPSSVRPPLFPTSAGVLAAIDESSLSPSSASADAS